MQLWIRMPSSAEFQSTLSVGRATATRVRVAGVHRISIHALREESDVDTFRFACGHVISIHALREEGDTPVHRRSAKSGYFNPRPPRGERPTQHRHGARCRVFQSTPSARRATQYVWAKNKEGKISIHALREESDVLLFQQILLQGYFNPRPPRGGRHRQSCRVCITTLFQSTPSARRATPCGLVSVVPLVYFNPRPPRGGRPTKHISTKCPT